MKKANQPGLSKLNLTVFKQIVVAACLATLVACGGTSSGGLGDSGGGPPRIKRNISVQSTGVTQPGLILQTNSGDELAIAENGTHYFNAEVPANDEYAITVKEQPAGDVCTVNNGSGLAVTDVMESVICSSAAQASTIGGGVAGLYPGSQIMLRNNGDDPLVINADGQFTFPIPVAEGGSYRVTVASLPEGQTCYVANGYGVAQGNVNNIEVMCQRNP